MSLDLDHSALSILLRAISRLFRQRTVNCLGKLAPEGTQCRRREKLRAIEKDNVVQQQDNATMLWHHGHRSGIDDTCTLRSDAMIRDLKRSLAAGILVASTASGVSSAFASGYGPAPFYRPDTGSTFSRHEHCGRHFPGFGSAKDTGCTTDADGASMPGSGETATPYVNPPTLPRQ
jgi:hypothetical protein